MAAGLIVAIVLCVILYLVLRLVLGLRGYQGKWLPLAVTLLTFPVLAVTLGGWFQAAFPQQGRSVTVDEANFHLKSFQLPTAAKDVNFRRAKADPCPEQADFAISQAEFLAWTGAMGWQAHVFQRGPDWPMPEMGGERDLPADMKFGFFFRECHTPDCRDRTFGYYDNDRQRASVRACRE